jgi:hypothetical protein
MRKTRYGIQPVKGLCPQLIGERMERVNYDTSYRVRMAVTFIGLLIAVPLLLALLLFVLAIFLNPFGMP